MTTSAFMGSQSLPWPGKRSPAREGRDGRTWSSPRSGSSGCACRSPPGCAGPSGASSSPRRRSASSRAGARWRGGRGRRPRPLRGGPGRAAGRAPRAGRDHPLRGAAGGAGGGRRDAAGRALAPRRARGGARRGHRGVRLALRPEPRDLARSAGAGRGEAPRAARPRRRVERERLAGDLARRDFKPDFTVQAGYMNRGGLDPMWQAGVGVTLPSSAGADTPRSRRRRPAAAPRRSGSRRCASRSASARGSARRSSAPRSGWPRSTPTASSPRRGLSYEASIASYQAGKVPFLDRPRGALDAPPRPDRPPARPRRARADQGLHRRGEPRGHLRDAVGGGGGWPRPRGPSAGRGNVGAEPRGAGAPPAMSGSMGS
jgi:hypothetical protein